MRILGIFGLFLTLALPSPSQEMTIRQLYQSLLAKSSTAGSLKPQEEEIARRLDAVRTLPEAEVDAIFPLAFQCATSPNAWVSQAGYDFFISVMLRFDSAMIFEPYIDDLGKLADEKDSPRRQLALMILGGLIPTPPEKAIAYLEANLENSRNTNQETQTITASLLKASKGNPLHPTPIDASIVHKVIAFTSARDDNDLTSNVLHELGLYRIQVPEAINFLSANLAQDDLRLRAAAVEAVSRLDKDTRGQFNGQLTRIASDPAEDQRIREDAARALQP